MAIAKVCPVKELDYVIATHQDPDIISSMDRWLMYSDAKILISRLWERFLPHLVPGYMGEKGASRIIAIPDQGSNIKFGDTSIKALPAHFLHSVGNFHFYDPTSKILFSGDLVYDGPLIEDAYHSNASDYLDSMKRLLEVPVRIVHAGHFPSYDGERHRTLIRRWLEDKESA